MEKPLNGSDRGQDRSDHSLERRDRSVDRRDRQDRSDRSMDRSDRESEPDTDLLDMAALRLQDWAEPPADQAQFNLSLQEWQVGGEKAGLHLPLKELGEASRHPADSSGCRRTRDKAQLTVRFEVCIACNLELH